MRLTDASGPPTGLAGQPGTIATIVDAYAGNGWKTSHSVVTMTGSLLVTYTNDAKGRLLGQAGAGVTSTFSYDAVDNTLLNWQQGDPPLTMAYDVASRIVTMLSGANRTTYAFDNNGNQIQSFLAGSGLSSDAFDYENRNIVNHRIGGSSLIPVISTFTFTYVGTEGCYTEPSGAIYMRAREVESPLTSWLTADPQWSLFSYQPYAYAMGSPTSLTDPNGADPGRGSGIIYDPRWPYGHVGDPNCVAWACNDPSLGGQNSDRSSPDGRNPYNPPVGTDKFQSCKLLKNLFVSGAHRWVWPVDEKCPANTHKVAIFVDPNKPAHYHVVRQDGRYRWSQKQGEGNPPNNCGNKPYLGARRYPIANPYTGYIAPFSHYCGFLCAPNVPPVIK